MKKTYTQPAMQCVPLLPNVLQTLSTQIGSDGATTGGRSNDMDFSWDDTAWNSSFKDEE